MMEAEMHYMGVLLMVEDYLNGMGFQAPPTSGAWIQVAPELNGQIEIASLAVFNNKLYGGTGFGTGRLFQFSEFPPPAVPVPPGLVEFITTGAQLLPYDGLLITTYGWLTYLEIPTGELVGNEIPLEILYPIVPERINNKLL